MGNDVPVLGMASGPLSLSARGNIRDAVQPIPAGDIDALPGAAGQQGGGSTAHYPAARSLRRGRGKKPGDD